MSTGNFSDGAEYMYTEYDNMGIFVEKQVRNPNFIMTYEHTHDYIEIFYLKTGQCNYTVENRKYHLSSGEVFIVPAGMSHCTGYEGKVRCERIIICIKPELIPEPFRQEHPRINDILNKSGKIVLSRDGRAKIEKYINLMLTENDLPDDYSSEMLRWQTILLFLTFMRNGIFVYESVQQEKGIPEDIEQTIHYIAMNYQSMLTLEDVAYKIGLSSTYLSKKFKKVTGRSFVEYITYIRLRQAQRMLLTTDNSITEIATDCGFNSSNYFKDCFRKLYGTSPKNFRMMMKESNIHGELMLEEDEVKKTNG